MKRLRFIRQFLRALIYNPLAALKYANRLLFKKNMSISRFNLQVYGPLVLKDTMDICVASGLKPFLNYGTLLGYYRDNNFIDTDNDIDYGIFEQDKPKLVKFKELMTSRGYNIRIDNKLELSFKCKKYGNLIVDFWIHQFNQKSNKIFSGCFFRKLDQVSIFPFSPDIIYTLNSVLFKKVDVYIPNNPEEYLKFVYGDDWHIPLDQEYRFREKTKFIYPNKLMISMSEFQKGDFL